MSALQLLSASVVSFLGYQVLFSTVLFSIAWIVSRCLRNRLPHLQYWLWVLVMLRLVMPTDLSAPWGAGHLLEVVRVEASFADRVSFWEPLSPSLLRASPAGGSVMVSVFEPALFLAWLFGLTGSGWLFLRRRRRCRAIIRGSVPVTDEPSLEIARRWRNILGVRRPVRLVSSDTTLSPFTIGVLRPTVHLPSLVLRRPDSSMAEAAIAHEMAHVAKWDDLRLCLQNIIRTIYFFHPVVWVTEGHINDTKERICDEMVLSRGMLAPQSYGRSLVRALELGLQSPRAAAGLGNGKRRIFMRVERIVNGRITGKGSRTASFLAAAVMGLFLLPMAESSHYVENTFGFSFSWPGSELPDLVNPLPTGRLRSAFGERKNPYTGQVEQHSGVDLAASRGSLIYAPADGLVRVAESGYEGRDDLGVVLILDHGAGTKTFFAHLGDLLVESGQKVRRQDPIAKVGTSGLTTGPHLHFEIWDNGVAVDPSLSIPTWSGGEPRN